MRIVFFILSLLFSLHGLAQNEGNIWYFGHNAGIDFNTTPPTALGDGALFTNEGCATICNSAGNLLFYTDGSTVYNANHVPMPNGTGLSGNSTSTQSAIVVQKPGAPNIYTIFTVDAQGQVGGLRYTEVDMTLDGGLGNTNATFDVQVYTPTCEKITAIKHQNGVDYWIVTQEFQGPNFRSYLYTATGLAATPVISDADMTPNTFFETIGYLRSNPQGNKIASAIDGGNLVKTYDFNNSTGAISNPIDFTSIATPYGVEFSPSGQYLYISQEVGAGNQGVFQFNMFAGSATNIINSQTLIGETGSYGGALQLAPDQKIYMSKVGSTSLATISNPDLPGAACDFTEAGFQLAPGTMAFLGLPTFHNEITIPSYDYFICLGESIELSNSNFTTFNWALENDPSTIISTDSSITVSPITSTTYLLFNSTDSVKFEVNVSSLQPLNLGPDICEAVDSVVLDAYQPDVTYLWQDNSTDSTLTVTTTGTYWVQITDGVCTEVDSIFIQFEVMEIQGPEVVYCDSSVQLSAVDSNEEIGTWTYVAPPGGPQNVIFSPGDDVINPLITVPELGEYSFIYTSVCGISDTHTVVFESYPPALNIQLSQACNFEINLIASSPVQNGEWTATGPNGATITIDDINQPSTTAEVSDYGEYTFTYTYEFCMASSSAVIDIQSIAPTILNTQELYICDKSIDLSAQVPGQAEQWSVDGPGIVTFSSFQSLNTTATVGEYGDYTFYFHGCGGVDTFDVSFTKTPPTIHAPTYVYCGTEALLEVFYYEDNVGTWSYEAETDENITLEELDNNMVSISSDSYGSVDVTYTTCDTSTTVNIAFMCELEIPNVFSPNNDGVNNEFFISRLNTKFYDRSKFVVYDRWGVEVYTNGCYGLEGSWWNGKTAKNGQDLEEGVYYYVLELHNKINDQDENYTGTVHIFR